MKKIVTLVGITLTLLSAALANSPTSPEKPTGESARFSSGFRAGVGVGYQRYNVENKYEYTPRPIVLGLFEDAGESRRQTSIRNTQSFQVHGGYDFIKNCWLLSLELDYRYSPGVNKGIIVSNDEFLSTFTGNFIFKQSHHHDFGLGFRIGRIVNSRFSVYAIANVRLGQFDYKFTSEKNTLPAGDLINPGKTKQFRWGGGIGAGFMYALPNGFSIGPEVTYDIYQPIKISQNLAGSGNSFFVKSGRPKIFNAMIKLSKTF